tara:strand:- start:8599 stop:9939 length:1341 start_codon:yes stop_codon:yes gene_type:complete
MKWIGQHIWDYISRFRNDVYLEDISTGTIASGGNLGLDSNNKIVKADTEAGELSFNGSTANGVLTYGGTAQIDVESLFTWDGDDLKLTSATSTSPSIQLINTNSDAVAPYLSFAKTATGADNDDLGKIIFIGDDASDNPQTYGEILCEIAEADHGSEEGKITLSVASHDGELQPGVKLFSGDAEDEVDVTLGNTQSSIITATGQLQAYSAAIEQELTLDSTILIDGPNMLLRFTPSTDDTATIAAATNGALSITTVDTAAHAADITITADGDAEIAADVITLDSAGDIELEVGATSNTIDTTGIFRGSNIGTIQDDSIPVSPTQFASSSFRYAVQYSLLSNGITMQSTGVNAYTEVVIPNGYKATHCTMKSTDADNDGKITCYEGSLSGGVTSALAGAGTFSSGTVTIDFGANDVTGNGTKTVIIEWNNGDTLDVLHGGHITIEKL